MSKLRILFSAVLAASMIFGLSACSPGKLDVSDVTAIIDLRDQESFEESHIVGAINIPFTGNDFLIYTTGLVKNGKYFIYGNNEDEVGQARADLVGRGYMDVTNLGDFENAQRILPLGVTN